MTEADVTVIFNPRAGGNKQRFLSQILQHAGIKVELLQTTHPGHARELARKVPGPSGNRAISATAILSAPASKPSRTRRVT